ncbi:MAG: RluA family pseudouridine synthase [Eubacteriales bacterium]|nr:RluA family pseudouridine synthase [Eubacteriales bacterium]
MSRAKKNGRKESYVRAGRRVKIEPEELIVYEDNHLLLVNKPVGMLSQGDKSGDPSLISEFSAFIKERDQKKGAVWLAPVHRLDRMVGGLIILAKSSKGAARLSREIREQRLVKRYYAVCHGKTAQRGEWTDYLSREKTAGKYRIVNSNGREASLKFERLAYLAAEDISLLSIELITGRPHQIRLQCAAHNFPLSGDQRYGNPALDKQIKLSSKLSAPALFAYQLGFKHPTKDCCLSIKLDLPSDGIFGKFKL